jgi:DNA-binding transcriptional regulator YiaG
MPRLKSFSPEKIAAARKVTHQNQLAFWSKFGITQSGGSRYENGRSIPTPTAMLLWLAESGRITDKDLEDAMKAVQAARR